MTRKQWTCATLASTTLILSLALTWYFVISVLSLHLSGGFGEFKDAVNISVKNRLLWIVSGAWLAAITAIAFILGTKRRAFIIAVILIVAVLTAVNIYTISVLVAFPVGNIAGYHQIDAGVI